MALRIHLLGSPLVERDGGPVPAPRGRKVWVLLAYLLLARSPVTRRALTMLLFSDAEDPFAALRWNLSELRKVLGSSIVLQGDPLQLRLGPDDVVDACWLAAGQWPPGVDLTAELLETFSFPTCPSLEVWLDSERRHLRGAAEALLRERALEALVAGDGPAAADVAGALVRLNPYDENFQALLVRSLAAAGDGIAAARQVAACRELFRRELGVEPGPAVAAALATTVAEPVASASTGRGGVVAQLQAGEAAIGAGAVDAGLQCLRRAVVDARALADRVLEVRALTALGTALVHAVRGQDEEGATALHAAVQLAGDRRELLADATRELGYIEFLRGRYDRVEHWLTQADHAAAGDAALRARVLCVRGSALSDVGRYAAAADALEQAMVLTPDPRRRSYALAMLGRVRLLRGEHTEAARLLDASYDLALGHSWTSFLPWPEGLRAGVHLALGEVDAAQERLEHAFALGCQVVDPCWEGLALRGLGVVAADRGEVQQAVRRLHEARARCTRLPDAYLWVDLYALEALCEVARTHGLPHLGAWTRELSTLASRAGMREFEVRALLHRHAGGEDGMLELARVLLAEVENPALSMPLAPVSPSATP
ncbi:MAG: BTAD domain-containing putative transcriptional regulator [Mycobacteriales bacterium]